MENFNPALFFTVSEYQTQCPNNFKEAQKRPSTDSEDQL